MNNNYEFNADNTDPDAVVCGSTELFRLTPSGEISDFGGIDGSATPGVGAGGLYGAGFGITLDPHGAVCVSNFGFQGTRSNPIVCQRLAVQRPRNRAIS